MATRVENYALIFRRDWDGGYEDCESGLKCFKRDNHKFVPGCNRGGIHDVEGKYILLIHFVYMSKNKHYLFQSNN